MQAKIKKTADKITTSFTGHRVFAVGMASASIAAFITLGVSTPAFADYECSVKERKATDAEIDTAKRTVAALQASLLPPPAGWTMTKPSGSFIEKSYCSDFKNNPITFGASATYAVLASAEAQRATRVELKRLNAEIKELEKLPPEMKAKTDQLDEANRVLVRESMAAQRAKDAALSKSKYAEAEVVSRESSEIKNKYSRSIDIPRNDLNKKRVTLESSMRPKQYAVSLTANAKVTKPAKNVLSFGSAAKTDQSTKNIVRVIAVFPDHADDATLEKLKALVDRSRLQSLAGNQVPTMEASSELIAKQAEAIKTLETSAQEFEKQIRDEIRKEESGVSASAAAKPAAATPATEAAKSEPATAQTAEPTKTAAQIPTQIPAKPQDPTQPAKDAVNKLKGLFGK